MKTATWPSPTLVLSPSPPMPTSITATSTGASANAANASTVSASKKVTGSSPAATSSRSTRSMKGSTSAQLRLRASSVMGRPSTTMRSLKRTRCGLVKRPVRRPAARRMLSVIRLVDVFPLVPVTCTIGYARCGSPRSSTTRRVADRRGCGACSPIRERSAWYTASPSRSK